MSTKPLFDWLSYVEKALLECDQVPMMGETPSFSWEELASLLGQSLGLEKLTITPKKWNWMHAEKIEEIFSDKTTCINVSVLPLQGKVSILLNSVDVNSLVTWLSEKRAGANGIIPSHFKNGFLNYVSVEVLHQLQSLSFFDGFLLRKLSNTSIASARSLALDIQLNAYGETLNLKLLIPETFRKNWMQHFLERPTSWTKRSLGSVEMKCEMQLGHFFRSLNEWKKVKEGDFIPVPNIHVDPETLSGSLNLTIASKPLFRIRLKEHGFKILEQMHFEEEAASMDDETLNGEDFSEEPHPEVSETFEEPSPKNEEMDFLDEEALEEPSQETVSAKATMLSKISEVPLNISVELTRFNMSCSKLLQLKPGNLLELDLPPEKPVDLVINGAVVAQGELIKVGEVIGVRILNRS